MRILWKIISAPFYWTWRTLSFIKEFILNLLVLIVIITVIWSYIQLRPKTTEVTKSALLIDLMGSVVDSPDEQNRLSRLGQQMFGEPDPHSYENSLFQLVETIRAAKTDNNITGIILKLDDFTGSDQPSLSYIGKALREFRDTGKPIYAVGYNYNQSQYYLASFANHIALVPGGAVMLPGLSTDGLYFKQLLDKLQVSTHIFRVGTYKSAVEPFIRDDMSPEARTADSRWVNKLWANYLTTVAANRQLTPEQLYPAPEQLLADLKSNGGNMALYAKQQKLVDELAPRGQIEQTLGKKFGWNAKKNRINAISIYDYQPSQQDDKSNHDKIAVIFANGPIIDGTKKLGAVSGQVTAAEIRSARLDPDVKALILRVNSPGGSVTASEIIQNALQEFRNSGKPVVISMGGMAASGGYWISTPGNYIIASPSTLTGSIGIFGVITTFEKTLDSIGVHSDSIATSDLAQTSPFRPLNPRVQQMVQLNIDNGYQRFLQLVAKARNKSLQQTDAIAQGRVWVGTDAKQNGLVDQLGDFDDAVSKAVELAKLKRHTLEWYAEEPSLLNSLLMQIDISSQTWLPSSLSNLLPATLARSVQKQIDMASLLTDPQYRYVLCLSCNDINLQ